MSDPSPNSPPQSAPRDQDALRRTVFEPDEEESGPTAPKLSAAARRTRAARPSVDDVEVLPCRPTKRPPVAVLQILDDSLKTAETVRIRTSPFVIGRTEGDLVLPHDPLISHRHAEITCTRAGEQWVWEVRDLESRNGTFVQVKEAIIEPGAEVLIARQRFRFEPATKEESPAAAPVADIRQTQAWPVGRMSGGEPEAYLIEWTPEGDGRRIPLAAEDQWIGRDPRRATVCLDDPTVNPSHARVFRDKHGRWRIEDDDTINGTWLRIACVPLVSGGALLVGEQVLWVVFP